LKHAVGMGARVFRVQNEAASAQAKQPVVASRGEERGSERVLHGCGFWCFAEKNVEACSMQKTIYAAARNIA
jgi:hypothetical protein